MTQTKPIKSSAGVLQHCWLSSLQLQVVNCVKYKLSDAGGQFAITKGGMV